MSRIEWTDLTINPIKAVRRDNGKVGWHCEKVSPACANCYAEALNKRPRRGYGTGLPYTVASTDLVTMWLDLKPFEKLARMRTPKKVFVCSMTDLFGEFVPDSFIREIFECFRRLPQHTFQLLTKRPQRMAELAPREPLPHVQFGVTAEDQPRADERIPWLLRTPAAKRFLSYEPALGPVRLWKLASLDYHENTIGYETYPLAGLQAVPDCDWKHSKLDWVIAGGESGPKARPAHPAWFRDVRDQCEADGVPFFFKQWGEWAPRSNFAGFADWDRAGAHALVGNDGKYTAVTGRDTPDKEFGLTCADLDGNDYMAAMARIGKKKAGRLLDGREWSEFPA